MRILHTADWHLGHSLRDHSRAAEHAHFLDWLVATVVERKVDALLIAGDVFDSANPPPAAWRMWFKFLGDLKRQRPDVQVVVIAGNHDSAARLEAPRELLAAFDVRVVGRLQRDGDGQVRLDDLVVPLCDGDGQVVAQCVAVPFLPSSDVISLGRREQETPTARRDGEGYVLPRPIAAIDDEGHDPLIAGMRVLHEQLFAAARERRQPGQAIVAMGHGYLVGGALSELSERKVLGGNQHALPVDLFPDDCAYVALGHLHRPQKVSQREHVRYSGSPIPLSMPERTHPHHVLFCDLDGEQVEKIWQLRTPRLVDLQRIPERGAVDPEEALAIVEALPLRDEAMAEELRPLVEVAVRLPKPSPQIGERIARAIADKNARLVRVDVQLTGSEDRGQPQPRELMSLSPEEVFVRRYARSYEDDVPEALLTAFRELLDEVENGGGA